MVSVGKVLIQNEVDEDDEDSPPEHEFDPDEESLSILWREEMAHAARLELARVLELLVPADRLAEARQPTRTVQHPSSLRTMLPTQRPYRRRGL
eukprot:6289296-Amphidinium_carterae.1